MESKERATTIEEAEARIIKALEGVDCQTAEYALARASNDLRGFAFVHADEKAREE
ncbi:MAG: hypothetical protein IJS96_08890 [Schwartzia sp.]|nr:hypothetical protein [Schwartzia sp. (in: firmicutes)]